MPELPDLVVWVPALQEALSGRKIAAVRVRDPIVLRVAVEGTLPSLITGRTIEAVERRGHFLRVPLSGGLTIVANLMLSGKFVLADEAPAKDPASLCFAWTLEGGREVHYLDDTRMGKIWLVDTQTEVLVPQYRELGTDVLGKTFTREVFHKLAAKRKDQARAFVMDKSTLASIGNAYADEILFAAGIHPKAWVRTLDEAAIDKLFDAIGQVIGAAVKEIRAREARPGEKIRDFLAVRGKKGQPCGVCGDTIRATQVHGHETCFCPTCQPVTRTGTGIIDWRKVSKGGAKEAPEPKDAKSANPAKATKATKPAKATAEAPRAPASRTPKKPPGRAR